MSTPGSLSDTNDFPFDETEYRRPRKAAPKHMLVESGTSDDEGPSSSGKRRQRKTKKPAAKRPKRESSDSEDDILLTEKQRELQIFKQIERQELLRTREEIQQKLMGKDVPDEKSKKKKSAEASTAAMADAIPVKPGRSAKESGEESSSDEEQKPQSGESSKPYRKESSEKEESDASEVELDPTYHRPSDIAKKIDKKQAIADLVKSRKEKRQNEERKREQAYDVDKIFGHGSKEEKSDDDSDDSSSSDSTSSDSDESDNDANDTKFQGEEVSSFEQLNRIRLSRHKLSKLCHAPFFDRTVIGCFVRINVGQNDGKPVYRAAQIVGVVEHRRVYAVEDTRTNKALLLKHGPDEREWRIEFVSNDKITNNEYFKWRDAMKAARLPLPYADYIEKKYKDIVGAMTYNFTEEDVKKMVEQRQKFNNVPTNHAAHKAELLKMKLDSDQNGDTERSKHLQAEIDEIDEIIKRKEMERCHDSFAISKINQRNREIQQKALAGSGRRNSDINKDDDPFTRKSGKMRVVSGSRKKDDEAMDTSSKDGDKDKTSKSTDNSFHHSKSAPSLFIDETLIFGDIPVPKAAAPQPVMNTTQSTESKSTGGISFAEFLKRRKTADK